MMLLASIKKTGFFRKTLFFMFLGQKFYFFAKKSIKTKKKVEIIKKIYKVC